MKLSIYLSLCFTFVFHSNLYAQGAEDEKYLVRDLRVIIAGNRPMPVFKTIGDKVIEVDPPLSKLPPTVFSFVNPKHAPKVKGSNGESKKKLDYTAWANNAVVVKNYKGPQRLELKLGRPLLEAHKSKQLITCDLKNYLKPVIILYPESSSSGWGNPQVVVTDLAKTSAVTVLNICDLSVDVYFSNRRVRVPHQTIRKIKLPANKSTAYRYKMQAIKGERKVIVANSSYTIRKNTKLVAILLPGIKIRASRLPRPNLKMILLPL